MESLIAELYKIRKDKEILQKRERELRSKIINYLDGKQTRILREGDFTVQIQEKYVKRPKKDLSDSSFDKSLMRILKIKHIKDVTLD